MGSLMFKLEIALGLDLWLYTSANFAWNTVNTAFQVFCFSKQNYKGKTK